MKLSKLIILLFLLFPFLCFGEPADVKVCFTPGEPCDKEIVSEINHENNRVWVQAYYLTARDIINAILSAKDRGADVKVILDKSQERNKRISVINLMWRHAIPVWIDNTVSIAHNKVIILGDSEVITGSYNFTKSAQTRNSENMLIIKSHEAATHYLHNFEVRLANSQKFQ